MNRLLIILPLLIFVVLGTTMYLGLQRDNPNDLPSTFIGGPAPALGTGTLPGIAGIVLTVGMAVDANVLIYERIREEIKMGFAPQTAIYNGFDRAFLTIIDSNITTLTAALVLFGLGSGPIKGFAITLSLGIATSIFTSVTLSRAIINVLYGRRQNLSKLSV
jgi:preprotein translocase subunit SecD